MNIRLALVFFVSGTVLAACGGGGVNNAMNPVPFTSFSAIQANQSVQANGISQTVNATTPAFGGNVTSTTLGAVDTANSTAQFSYGNTAAMSAFSFNTPASSVSFSGLSVLCTAGTGVCGSSSANSVGAVLNPVDPRIPPAQVPPIATAAWNYQSFGYWLVNLSSTTAVAGVMSFGNPTPVAGLPATGSATYSGLSSGLYIDPNGAVFVHVAQMLSTATFGGVGIVPNVSFSTANTAITPINSGVAPISALALNLNGTLTITPGTSRFSGAVFAPGGTVNGVATPAMTGTASGQFYGPGAGPILAPAEMGGVFSLKATTNPAGSPQTMLGGFGGKQP
jgi:hypothetical protein